MEDCPRAVWTLLTGNARRMLRIGAVEDRWNERSILREVQTKESISWKEQSQGDAIWG